MFHPDEPLVALWIDQTRDEGRIVDRVYPSGWFELFRIRLWAERKIEQWSKDWERHSVQNGVVSAVHERTYAWKAPPPPSDPPGHTVQDGRDFNAWLFVLSAVLLYLAATEAGMRPAAALASAAFFLASPGPAEFCRYCETDAGLIVSLAFFSWCAARALRRRSFIWTALASFAAGFAVSCKYSLALLALWPPLVALSILFSRLFADEAPRGGKKGGALRLFGLAFALTVGALVLAAAGFLVGTPGLWMAPDWWMASCRDVSAGTYSEILSNIGGEPSWSAATIVRTSDLVRHLAALGAPTLLWGAFSWSFWLRPAFRRQLAGLPLLLPAFLPFAACALPFVRSQETLPIAIVLSFGAGLPLEWWLRRRADGAKPSKRLRAAACAAAFVGAIALGDGALRTSGMISCFGLRDTRVEAQNWLLASLPADTPVAFDGYVGQVARGVPCLVSIQPGGLQWRWNGTPEPCGPGLPPPRYYVENVGFTGRFAVLDLGTGLLKTDVRGRLDAWRADTFPIREWAVPSDVPRPTFGQTPVRLVTFDVPPPGAPDASVVLPRPLCLLPPDAPLYDASGPACLGAAKAFRLVGKRTAMRLVRDGAPRWFVARFVEGDSPARAVIERAFRPKKSELRPAGAIVAALHPSLFDRLFARASAWPAAKARLRGDDQRNFVAAYLTPSAAEAARTLRLCGDPAGSLALLREAGVPDAAARVEAFLAAKAAGEPVEPAWEATAREAVAACEAVAAAADRAEAPAGSLAARRAASVCGVPLGAVVDFSRLRLVRQAVAPGVRLPAFLPPGRHTVVLAPPRPGASLPESLPERLFAGQAGESREAWSPDGERRLVADVDIPASGAFLVPAAGPSPFKPFFAEVEISWSVAARLREAAAELRTALASDAQP